MNFFTNVIAAAMLLLNVNATVFCQSMAKRVDMNDFFGVNVFKAEEAPADIAKVSTWIRDYSQWAWLEPENNSYRFTNALGNVNYDDYYKRLDSFNIKSLFVVQQTPKWISAGKNAADPYHYAPSGDEDGLKPAHYKEAASFYYQLAARYGNTKHPPAHLQTGDKISGLNLVDVIEVYNEPDGTWGNKMTSEQYAALLNAVYDGNNGKLKGRYGVKTADPSMKVSLGGLAYNFEPLKKIVASAGRAPFDIINVHFYTFRWSREKFRVTVPPEWSSLESDMKEIVDWGVRNAPGKPVWLTEIGFDTKPHSTEYVTEQEAANYLIRSYLLALGAGVEKCFWFIFRDLDNGKKPTVFSSSGLFENDSVAYNGQTRLKPKLTYWYNGMFKSMTEDYYFTGAVDRNRDTTVYRYDFSSADDKKRLSVLWYCPAYEYDWLPLSNRPSSKNHELIFPQGDWKIKQVVRPAGGTFKGQSQPYSLDGNRLRLSLNATPLFVELERK